MRNGSSWYPATACCNWYYVLVVRSTKVPGMYVMLRQPRHGERDTLVPAVFLLLVTVDAVKLLFHLPGVVQTPDS